eukprot:Blabericola_migrator_1__5302@NODE_271_length_10510_cov_106_175333_g226_i0_p3_GENE_NODE_271_length_10510_cov_106_175333_g226_i0NODE_271_length_10510_cov_106_175333_g226_i0_p3_ORF_typecomplete_len260_score12_43_NODE_271_length_10510_cov_106_175333_g226_i06681447
MSQLLVISFVAEFCSVSTMRKLKCLSREISECLDHQPFVYLCALRWARGNQHILTNLQHYYSSFWYLLVSPPCSLNETIEDYQTLSSCDGRRFMLRIPVRELLNFLTMSNIPISEELGYLSCSAADLCTSMNGDDLSLRLYLFPVKDPNLEVKITMYSNGRKPKDLEESFLRAERRPSPVTRVSLSSHRSLKMERSLRPILTPLSSDVGDVSPVRNVVAHVRKGTEGAYAWHSFIPDFRNRFQYYENEGLCYMQVQFFD